MKAPKELILILSVGIPIILFNLIRINMWYTILGVAAILFIAVLLKVLGESNTKSESFEKKEYQKRNDIKGK